MSRPDFDDYDAPPPGPPRRGTPVALAAVLAAALVVVLTACGGAALYWARSARVADEQAQLVTDAEAAAAEAASRAQATARVYSRDEFRALVMGKTITEVSDLLGPSQEDAPDVPRRDEGTDTLSMHYRGRTIDPATGRPDGWVRVVFNFRVVRAVDARVIRVEFVSPAVGPAPEE